MAITAISLLNVCGMIAGDHSNENDNANVNAGGDGADEDEMENPHLGSQSSAPSSAEEVEIDDEEGLTVADDVCNGINMKYYRLIRERLKTELSSRGNALDQPWLLAHLKRTG